MEQFVRKMSVSLFLNE